MKAKNVLLRGQCSAGSPFWGFLTVLVVCATAAFVFWRFVPAGKASPPRRLWTPLVVNNLNTEMIVPDSLRLEFWTPSARTRDYLSKETITDTNRNWEAIPNDEPVMDFGKLLRNDPDVLGY